MRHNRSFQEFQLRWNFGRIVEGKECHPQVATLRYEISRVAGELLFLTRFLRIPRPATIL
jgi:hypothetical protein